MHTWIIYEWEKNASWWIKKSLIFPIGGAKEHLMHPTFYCFNISWLKIVSKRHQWLAIFNQPDFVALVDDSKTNRWENHRAKKKGKKEKPTATRHSSTKGVSMCGRMVTMMSLKSSRCGLGHAGWKPVARVPAASPAEWRGEEEGGEASAYTKLILLCTYVGQTPLWVAFIN